MGKTTLHEVVVVRGRGLGAVKRTHGEGELQIRYEKEEIFIII